MKVKLRVFRGREGEGHYQEFELDVDEGASVLDCLELIRFGMDETLVYNRACHHGVCGACAMLINGKERLACITKVKDLGEEITVEPLKNFRVIKDLLVDPSPMFSKLKLVGAKMLKDSEGYKVLDECVECGACYSSCPTYSVFKGFLGPSAIHFFAKEPKEEGLKAEETGLNGLWTCLLCRRCVEVCPYDVDVPRDARELRRAYVRVVLRKGG